MGIPYPQIALPPVPNDLRLRRERCVIGTTDTAPPHRLVCEERFHALTESYKMR
jgi:hypothetical protein